MLFYEMARHYSGQNGILTVGNERLELREWQARIEGPPFIDVTTLEDRGQVRYVEAICTVWLEYSYGGSITISQISERQLFELQASQYRKRPEAEPREYNWRKEGF
jgi:hypothetical protein